MLTRCILKDAIISDLFFNSELTVAARDADELGTQEPPAMVKHAIEFCDNIKALTDGALVIEPERLLADFEARL